MGAGGSYRQYLILSDLWQLEGKEGSWRGEAPGTSFHDASSTPLTRVKSIFLMSVPSGPALGQDIALISPGAQDSNAI